MKVVLDTNVLVSGLLKPQSKPARILRLILQGHIQIVPNEPILVEYQEVLKRPKFALEWQGIEPILGFFRLKGFHAPAVPESFHLPDPADEVFLEAALGADADALITGNKKHYPVKLCKGLKVLTPEEFLKSLSPFSGP